MRSCRIFAIKSKKAVRNFALEAWACCQSTRLPACTGGAVGATLGLVRAPDEGQLPEVAMIFLRRSSKWYLQVHTIPLAWVAVVWHTGSYHPRAGYPMKGLWYEPRVTRSEVESPRQGHSKFSLGLWERALLWSFSKKGPGDS